MHSITGRIFNKREVLSYTIMPSKDDLLYFERYADLPDDRGQLVKLLQDKLYPKDLAEIGQTQTQLESIPWDEIKIILYVIPRSTPRPRYSPVNHRFYVKNASDNRKLIKILLQENDIITTRTEVKLDVFMPTPKAMNRKETLLAEQGYIRPLCDPDWDNIGKTYTDMLNGLLLLDDNIITKGTTEFFYSIKPRVEITVRWQANWDSKFNQKRIQGSKLYRALLEVGI